MGKAEVLQWMINHGPLIFVIVAVAATVIGGAAGVDLTQWPWPWDTSPPPPPTPGGGTGSAIINCDLKYHKIPSDGSDPSLIPSLSVQSIMNDQLNIHVTNIPNIAGNYGTICPLNKWGTAEHAGTLNDYILNKLKCAPGWKTEIDHTGTNDSIIDHLIIGKDSNNDEYTDAIISSETCKHPREPGQCIIDVNLDKLEGCNKRYCEISEHNNEFTINVSGPLPSPLYQLDNSNISLLKYWDGQDIPSPTDKCLFGPNCQDSVKTTTIGNMNNTTITCADGKYGKCEGVGECSEHDNNQPACEAAPPAANCSWTPPTHVNLDPSVLTCGPDPGTWSNNHNIHTKCNKDCYVADATDPVTNIDPCPSFGDPGDCNNEHCEYINGHCTYKYIYKNDNIVNDKNLEGKFTVDGEDPPDIGCPPNSYGSISYNIGDSVETGECIPVGGGAAACHNNKDEISCSGSEDNCSWYAYDNDKQKICTGGGAEFNITNNCLPLTCESWNAYDVSGQGGCGAGKHLNPNVLNTPPPPNQDIVDFCCLDNDCADVSCDGGQGETSIFQKRDFSSNDPGYDTPADKDITCCDIKTCEDYNDHTCPEGQTQSGAPSTNVVDLECLGTINIQGYTTGDKQGLFAILQAINSEITLQNIEQDGNNYILKNTPENPLTIRKSQIDALITRGDFGADSVETSIKTREEWARDGLCDYYHRSTSSSNKCCQHQTCSDFAAAQNGLCTSDSQYLINTNIPNNTDDIPHHTATEEACCSDIDNFERAVAQAEGVNQVDVDSGQNKIRCYRDKDTTIDILNEYINFNDSGTTKKLPPYIDFDFTISDGQGSSSREVNINPIDGGPEPPSTGNYYDLREARCKVGGSNSNITISCSEDKNTANNAEWVNRREAEGELAEIMTEYGLESGNKDELIRMLDNEGRWKYHIHGCIDDDNLFCSFPTDNYPSGRYNIQIETVDMSDHTRLYPLGLLKYNMDNNPPYGISCVNDIPETQSEDLPAQSAASNYLHENNTLSEFYIIKDDIQHIHKERDISQKNVIPYCPEQRGEYMFAGCNLKFGMRDGDDLDTNYIKDGDDFYPTGDIFHIPTLTREQPHPSSAAISTCNDLINEREEDSENDVLCHGPDNARFFKIYQYCGNPDGPCYQSHSRVTKSYSSILTDGNSPSIFNDVCKENYYPEGLDINDITRSSAFPTRRDICVPKNDEHGYEYNMKRLDTYETLPADFFVKAGGAGTTAKNFTEILQNPSLSDPHLLTAHCQPDGSTDPPPLSGSCHGSDTCDGQDKESCESEGCEWWPNYSCKKTGSASGSNSIQGPEDYSTIETAILDNVNNQTLDIGWPQPGSIGVHFHNDGTGTGGSPGGYDYVGIPIYDDLPQNDIHCYSKQKDGAICDPSAPTKQDGIYSCQGECVPKISIQGGGTEAHTYDLIQIGDTMDSSDDNPTPHTPSSPDGVLLKGIKIPIDQLKRNSEYIWRSLLNNGSPGGDDSITLNNFPQASSEFDNFHIDIRDASQFIVHDDQVNLNPEIESCSNYFSGHNSETPVPGAKGFYPGSNNGLDQGGNAKLYCKKQCDPNDDTNCEIKGSFYYGKIDNNIIDITRDSAYGSFSKHLEFCGAETPYLVKVAEGDQENSYYICSSCAPDSNLLAPLLWSEDGAGTTCSKDLPDTQCKCVNDIGVELPTVSGASSPLPADTKNCKWRNRPRPPPDHPEAPPEDHWVLEGCLSCDGRPNNYLTYANGTQTGEGILKTYDFPSRFAGNYPGEYVYARNKEYEYAGGEGIFQPGDGGWNRTVETKGGYYSPDGLTADQHRLFMQNQGKRDKDIDHWMAYAAPWLNTRSIASSIGEGGVEQLKKSMHYGYEQVATLPAGTTWESDNPLPATTDEAQLLLREAEQDPNEWYHPTVCRNKHFGTVAYLDSVPPPPPPGSPAPDQVLSEERSPRFNLSLWSEMEENLVTEDEVKFINQELDPRLYEFLHLDSRCSADTVWGSGSGVEGPPWVGDSASQLDNRGFIGGGSAANSGHEGCYNPNNLEQGGLKCCADGNCLMWDQSRTANIGYLPKSDGTVDDVNPYLTAVRSASPTYYVAFPEIYRDGMYGPRYDSEDSEMEIFPYRGRCLKDTGQPCTSDNECYGGGCCGSPKTCHGGPCPTVLEETAITGSVEHGSRQYSVGECIFAPLCCAAAAAGQDVCN